MSKGDIDADGEDVPVVVEAYGFKVELPHRPETLGERAPDSWRDVPAQVNRHLMRIVAAPTRLIAEVLEGVTRLVRGLSRMPDSVASRMEYAHREADKTERQRQELVTGTEQSELTSGAPHGALTSDPSSPDTATLALDQIQKILQKYIARGLDAYAVLGPDGKVVIVLGTPPGSETQICETLKEAQSLLANPIEQDRS